MIESAAAAPRTDRRVLSSFADFPARYVLAIQPALGASTDLLVEPR